MVKLKAKSRLLIGGQRAWGRKVGRATLWLLCRPAYVYLVVLLIVGLLLGASITSWKLELPQVARDVAMVEYAHLKAGPPIPVDPKVVDYEAANILKPEDTWGIVTNSVWLSQTSRRIVPYFYYIGLVGTAGPQQQAAAYPVVIAFFPMDDEANFHMLGQEHIDVVAVPVGGRILIETGPVIQLNERMVVGDATDMRVLLSTLIHENIHGQGGNFTFSGHCPDPITSAVDLQCWQDESAQLESNTQTATIETLAAYCNHQNELACKTFWYEVSSAASASLQVWAWNHNVPWLYDFLDKHLWLTNGQGRQYDASMRYWAYNNPDGLKAIVLKYGKMVWDKVLLGTTTGQRMASGNFGLVRLTATAQYYQEAYMTFDDVVYMLGRPWVLLLRLLQ